MCQNSICSAWIARHRALKLGPRDTCDTHQAARTAHVAPAQQLTERNSRRAMATTNMAVGPDGVAVITLSYPPLNALHPDLLRCVMHGTHATDICMAVVVERSAA
jgi:hypothetical protein